MRHPDLSPWLFFTPLTSTVLASHQVTSARASFLAATGLVEVLYVVDNRLRRSGYGQEAGVPSRLREIWTTAFLPTLALCLSFLLLAAASSSPAAVATGLRTAGFVGIALSLALALVIVFGRVYGSRRARITQLLVADVAKPVTSLSPVSWDALADLSRLAHFGYGAVQDPSSPRLVCYRDVCNLPVERAVVAWRELGSTVPTVDGARPASEVACWLQDDEVWLVTAGDLVIGVLTSDAARPSAGTINT